MHTYARMLTFCVTEIIYYININLVYAFIESTNMIYHNCVNQGDVYYINQIWQGHIFNHEAFKVSINAPLKGPYWWKIIFLLYFFMQLCIELFYKIKL